MLDALNHSGLSDQKSAQGVRVLAAQMMLIFLFCNIWYLHTLSFPLVGEDGATQYSNLTEMIQDHRFWSSSVPLKWREGLGQPNLFLVPAFDPFSWLLFLPGESEFWFRVSMALRAFTCWLATYGFARSIGIKAAGVCSVVALVNMYLNFMLTGAWGIPTFAGIYNATHSAIFPAMMMLIALLVRQRSRIGLHTGMTFGFSLLLALTYPIGSVLPLCVAGLFCVITCIWPGSAALSLRERALRTALGCAALAIPFLALWPTWAAVVGVSARSVFSTELVAYGQQYLLPHLWHDVTLPMRLIILLSVITVAATFGRRNLLTPVIITLLIVILGVQTGNLIKLNGGVLGSILDRLPRLHYLEFYLPVLYAVLAGFTVAKWRLILRLLNARSAWNAGLWLRVAAISGFAAILFTMERGYVSVFMVFAGIVVIVANRSTIGRALCRRSESVGSAIAVATWCVAGIAGWYVWPAMVHPVFKADLLCNTRDLLCKDGVGRTLGAAGNPITEFLKQRLNYHPHFSGRADTLLVPAPKLRLAKGFVDNIPPWRFDTMLRWYSLAYTTQHRQFPHSGYLLSRAPSSFSESDLPDLAFRIRALTRSTDTFNGILPESVAREMLKDSESTSGVTPVVKVETHTTPEEERRRRSSAEDTLARDEVTLMVEERTRAWLATGNGFLLRSLPLQGIPVASSYEQALDYLYYLFWTRYINFGSIAQPSINMTTLHRADQSRLALVGIRYLIARNSIFAPPPDLQAVFSWKNYTIYEVPDANISGFAVRNVIEAGSIEDELRAMRDERFDPRSTAVISRTEASRLSPGRLSAVSESSIELHSNQIRVRAKSTGESSLLVLPFKYSHCWAPHWLSAPGMLIRADTSLLAIQFRGILDVSLKWKAGYFSSQCLRDDRDLIPSARAAAHSLPVFDAASLSCKN